MKVLVDTSVWLLALRKQATEPGDLKAVSILSELIRDLRVEIIGPVRQEILSGISDPINLQIVKERLSAFSDIEIMTEDYERAAQFSNECRKNGIQGSHTDFLICSVSVRLDLLVFTLDANFRDYLRFLPIRLFG
ncbi:MAG: PIN domain-containing protein [Bacteroidetes bacterium]|nr:PIN domain-containing protein [Bacteroidota bacterium]